MKTLNLIVLPLIHHYIYLSVMYLLVIFSIFWLTEALLSFVCLQQSAHARTALQKFSHSLNDLRQDLIRSATHNRLYPHILECECH